MAAASSVRFCSPSDELTQQLEATLARDGRLELLSRMAPVPADVVLSVSLYSQNDKVSEQSPMFAAVQRATVMVLDPELEAVLAVTTTDLSVCPLRLTPDCPAGTTVSRPLIAGLAKQLLESGVLQTFATERGARPVMQVNSFAHESLVFDEIIAPRDDLVLLRDREGIWAAYAEHDVPIEIDQFGDRFSAPHEDLFAPIRVHESLEVAPDGRLQLNLLATLDLAVYGKGVPVARFEERSIIPCGAGQERETP